VYFASGSFVGLRWVWVRFWMRWVRRDFLFVALVWMCLRLLAGGPSSPLPMLHSESKVRRGHLGFVFVSLPCKSPRCLTRGTSSLSLSLLLPFRSCAPLTGICTRLRVMPGFLLLCFLGDSQQDCACLTSQHQIRNIITSLSSALSQYNPSYGCVSGDHCK
jgi:hypothetical protein